MKCGKCGSAVALDAAFCSKCGTPVDIDDADGPDEAAANARHAPAAARVRAGADSRRPGRGAGVQAAEQELWSGTFSPKAMFGPAIGCAIVTVVAIFAVAAFANNSTGWTALLIGLAVLWGWLGLTLLYRRLTVRYRLTNYRLFHDTGLLSRTGNRIEAIDIDDVTVRQGLIERMFAVGSIHIASSDRTDPSLLLPGIEDVRTVADLIDSTRRAERHRRGLHIESI